MKYLTMILMMFAMSAVAENAVAEYEPDGFTMAESWERTPYIEEYDNNPCFTFECANNTMAPVVEAKGGIFMLTITDALAAMYVYAYYFSGWVTWDEGANWREVISISEHDPGD